MFHGAKRTSPDVKCTFHDAKYTSHDVKHKFSAAKITFFPPSANFFGVIFPHSDNILPNPFPFSGKSANFVRRK